MASLVVTFTRAASSPFTGQPPVEVGSDARTELIDLEGGTGGPESAAGELMAQGSENIVSLYAQAACWIAISTEPEAEAESGRFMDEGERLQLWVSAGQKVAAIGVAE